MRSVAFARAGIVIIEPRRFAMPSLLRYLPVVTLLISAVPCTQVFAADINLALPVNAVTV